MCELKGADGGIVGLENGLEIKSLVFLLESTILVFERVGMGVNCDTDRNDIDWTPNLVGRGVDKFGTQGCRRICRICNWGE